METVRKRFAELPIAYNRLYLQHRFAQHFKGLAQLLYRQLVSYCFQFAPQLVKAFITVPDQPFCAASFGAERRLPIGTA
jgi:hypothetical protein